MEKQEFNREQVWTRFWASGALHSCSGSYADQYGDSVTEFWTACFKSLPLGSRILDIGTGNGVLPKLLINMKDRTDFICDAIDLAEPKPVWFANISADMRARVHFHSHCSAEKLPFPDNTFDLVVSQWGLEYTDLSRSCEEILRVLKPSGIVQLVLHHPQAVPAMLASFEIEHIEWLLQEAGYLDIAEQMLAPMALANTEAGRIRLKLDLQATLLRIQFNAFQDGIKARTDSMVCSDVLADAQGWIAQLFALAQRVGASTAEREMQRLRVELKDSLFRQRELLHHAMTSDEVTSLGINLARGGTVSKSMLQDNERVLGWALRINPLNAIG